MVASAIAPQDPQTPENPLLIGEGIPPFDQVETSQVVPAVTQLLQELETAVAALETNLIPTWAGLVEPLTHLEERLGWTWGLVSHLLSVKNSPELRTAYETVQPQLVQFNNRFSQSKPIYEGFKAIRDGDQWQTLEPAQKRIIEAGIRDAELSGVALEGEVKETFNQIQMELAELGTKFSNHVLDATKAFSLRLTQGEEVAGLPDSALSLAAQTARGQGDEAATAEAGPWVITLDYPSYLPFMKYAENSPLREKLYKAFISRASSGEFDNNPLITQILALRKRQAEILGFASYAELSLARKMASSVAEVEQLLEELRQVSYGAAQEELEALQTFANQGDLQPWDLTYWSEKQREAKFGFKAEELRPYFSLPRVLDGLFDLAQRLFGVIIRPADGQAPLWHGDVRYFQIDNSQGEAIAYFYLDPYSRPSEKRGGAWMNDCLNRHQYQDGPDKKVRLPIAYLICNQTPPVDDKPSLMTFGEVETLFHEFGHGLQHMLTQVNYTGAAGIHNVEWDAVELPSQFMENWCYHRETLMAMAKHYKTGETLPEEYYQKLLAARTYMSGSAMLRQLHFSFLDLELHHRYDPQGSETPQQVRDRLAKTTTVIPPLPEDQFMCSFGHIFAGGYAAGYYSYKWAEVLSADAFSAFEEAGLDDPTAIAKVGQKFAETVLGLGGSVHPMEVFKAFRGREPKTEALLRHSGLLAAS